MELYFNPLSTYSQKVMIAFNEKGLTYEPKVVHLMDPAGRAEYEKINPLGKVPYFKPSPDWSVPESTSIIEYLEDKFPETASLIPKNGGDAARQVRFMDRMADNYFDDPVVELLFQKLGFKPVNEEAAEKARKHIKLTYEHLDQRLAKQDWLCGEFSMADCAMIPPLFYAQMAAPFDAYPNVQRYWERAQQRPSYAAVKAQFEPIWNGMMAQKQA
jgi:glutathione S-transferase